MPDHEIECQVTNQIAKDAAALVSAARCRMAYMPMPESDRMLALLLKVSKHLKAAQTYLERIALLSEVYEPTSDTKAEGKTGDR